jgi:hypothetical protein
MVIELPLWVVRFWPVILLDIAWEAVWKVIALWKAGRNAHMVWFICLFIFNTLGILPIIYIFAFSKKKA